MRILGWLILAWAAFLAAAPALARSDDGMIVARQPYRPTVPTYDALISDLSKRWQSTDRDPPFDEQQFRRYFPSSRFDEMLHQRNISFERITYLVDGLRVPGFVAKPRRHNGKLPVLFYARGGNTAPLEPDWRADLVGWAQRGYVVIATDFRGLPGNEGRDEFGGADVDDLLVLPLVARSIPDADTDRMFLYGHSRGSMMALIALARGLPVRAAALTGTVSNLEAASTGRADMQKVFKRLMPDLAEEQANHFCRRSAICWPERIKAPLLIQHGGSDWRSPPTQALQLAEALQHVGGKYELVIYEGDDHRLTLNHERAIDRMFDWFVGHGAKFPSK